MTDSFDNRPEPETRQQKEYRDRMMRTRAQAVMTRDREPWTAWEDELLTDPNYTDEHRAIKLGRSYAAVAGRRKVLGVRKKPKPEPTGSLVCPCCDCILGTSDSCDCIGPCNPKGE